MITRRDNEIFFISYGGKIINTVFYGAKIVWQSIIGWWINLRPWRND